MAAPLRCPPIAGQFFTESICAEELHGIVEQWYVAGFRSLEVFHCLTLCHYQTPISVTEAQEMIEDRRRMHVSTHKMPILFLFPTKMQEEQNHDSLA